MFQLELPSITKFPYRYTTILDNISYVFFFSWSVRAASWYVSISTVEEVPLVSNIRLVPNLDLFTNFPKSIRPKGRLFLISNSEDYKHPPAITFDNINTDFTLLYEAAT